MDGTPLLSGRGHATGRGPGASLAGASIDSARQSPSDRRDRWVTLAAAAARRGGR